MESRELKMPNDVLVEDPQLIQGMDLKVESDEYDGESLDDQPLIVMDPDHPLMERVQAALKDQLTRQNERLELELKEKIATLKSLQKYREDLGVELYSVQQQLARQQMLVEAEQDRHATMHQVRMQKDIVLDDIRTLHKEMSQQLRNQRQQTLQLRQDAEKLASKLQYLNEAHKNMKSDIVISKRTVEKATADINQAQDNMLRQDFFVDHLMSTIYKHEEQLSLYDVQYTTQAKETMAIREAVTEAATELETVLLEKKRLLQQWNSTLIGMRRRDEAYAAMQAAINTQEQHVNSLESEIDNYKKSILKEEETNEKLTLHYNKATANVERFTKQIEISETKKSQLEAEYMNFTRILQEIQQSLSKETTDFSLKNSEMDSIRTKFEREALEKRELQYAAMEKKVQRLTMNKANQYTVKTIETTRNKYEELEIKLTNGDNEISRMMLQISEVTSQLLLLQQHVDRQNASMLQINDTISQAETEVTKNNAKVERKQTQIDQLNKKISPLVAKLGMGEELGPLELKIEGLKKQVVDSVQECNKMQEFWLRQQNELVKQTKSSEEQREAINSLEKRLLIMDQKKLRLDDQLCGEEGEHAQVDHRISSLQKDLARLSTLIMKKKGQQENLEQESILLETDFIQALKEEELKSIQLQAKLDSLKDEKKRVLNSLMEAERQIMLWSKKTQLAREMKEAVEDSNQVEICALKAEIHRMQVRHDHMRKQQEKMIRDMEKSVNLRESIILKGEIQEKSGRKEQTQGHLEMKIRDKEHQLQLVSKDISSTEESLDGVSVSQNSITKEMEAINANCRHLSSDIDNLQDNIEFADENKRRGTIEFILSQFNVKSLMAASEGKYKLITKTLEGCEAEWQRQVIKLLSLQGIVERLHEDFPTYGRDLLLLSLMIRSRLSSQSTNGHLQAEGETT